MSIVHNAATYMPDLLDHMAENYPNLTVKNGVLGRNSDIESTNMASFKEQVSNYVPNVKLWTNEKQYCRFTRHIAVALFAKDLFTRFR